MVSGSLFFLKSDSPDRGVPSPAMMASANAEPRKRPQQKVGNGPKEEFWNSSVFAQFTLLIRPLVVIEHEDFSVVVKGSALSPTSWHWEIYRAGRSSAIERSKAFFETAREANRAGKLALRLLLSEYPD